MALVKLDGSVHLVVRRLRFSDGSIRTQILAGALTPETAYAEARTLADDAETGLPGEELLAIEEVSYDTMGVVNLDADRLNVAVEKPDAPA